MASMATNDLKRVLLRASPHLFRALGTIKQRFERGERMRVGHRLDCIAHDFVEKHGRVVQSGPFEGMTYVSQAAGSALLPKLLGSYEAELHNTLAYIFKQQYDSVVNVGCGEGYYAVGFARCLPEARIYAFDIDAGSQELCVEMARVNNVSDRVVVGGRCDTEQLRALTRERALVVMDCEGCELDLLQPSLVHRLDRCDLLVELHDFINPKISRTILSRFAPTHDITVIDTAERDYAAYPALCACSVEEQRLAVAEFRPTTIPMQWAFMTAKL